VLLSIGVRYVPPVDSDTPPVEALYHTTLPLPATAVNVTLPPPHTLPPLLLLKLGVVLTVTNPDTLLVVLNPLLPVTTT
jgi:hypothetical protein